MTAMLAAAVGVNDFRMNDFAVRSFIKLEMFGVAEMPKNLTVFIGNCNFHNEISFAFFFEFFCVGSLHPAAPWRSWHGRFPSSVFGIYRLWHFEQKKAIFFQKPLQFLSSYRCWLIFGVESNM